MFLLLVEIQDESAPVMIFKALFTLLHEQFSAFIIQQNLKGSVIICVLKIPMRRESWKNDLLHMYSSVPIGGLNCLRKSGL